MDEPPRPPPGGPANAKLAPDADEGTGTPGQRGAAAGAVQARQGQDQVQDVFGGAPIVLVAAIFILFLLNAIGSVRSYYCTC
eukprot:tig00020952_g16503.t1